MDSDKTELEKTGVRRGLENLTAEDGPLYALVGEVQRSNALAVKNSKRMFWSLILLWVTMAFMLFMTLVVLASVGVMVDAKDTLADVAHNVRIGVDDVKSLVDAKDDAPEVVVSETGEITLSLPSVKIEEGFGEAEEEDPDPVPRPAPKPKEPAFVEQIFNGKAKAAPAPRPAMKKKRRAVAKKRVSIPINMEQLEFK